MTERTELTPIYLSYGHHSRESVRMLPDLKERMASYLDGSAEGKIVYFMESAYCPEEVCEYVREKTDQGAMPLSSYIEAYYLLKNKRFISGQETEEPCLPKDEFKELKREFFDDGDVNSIFDEEEIGMLDSLARKYPGRIVLQIESTPQGEEERKTDKRANGLMRDYEELYIGHTLEGEFDLALEALKIYASLMQLETKRRDQRIADQIMNSLESNNIIAVVGRFGSAHTNIYHLIKREGLRVIREFDGEDNFGYWYSPLISIIRKLRFSKNPQISQIEWYQALIGVLLENIIIYQGAGNGEVVNEQKVIRKVNRVVKRLNSMDQIRKFEALVRETESFGGVVKHFKLINKKGGDEENE